MLGRERRDMLPARREIMRIDVRGRARPELAAQSREQRVDVLLAVVELGQLLRETGDALRQLLPGLGDALDALRQAHVAVALERIDAAAELRLHVVEPMDQRLDATALVLERHQAPLQRAELLAQVEQQLPR